MSLPDDDVEISELRKKLVENPQHQALIFFYYKGHANVVNGMIRALGSDERMRIESFLRRIAQLSKKVFVIGLFDCCRRDRGSGGMDYPLTDAMNIVCLYREEPLPYESEQCTTCDPSPDSNFAASFFSHLRKQMKKRQTN